MEPSRLLCVCACTSLCSNSSHPLTLSHLSTQNVLVMLNKQPQLETTAVLLHPVHTSIRTGSPHLVDISRMISKGRRPLSRVINAPKSTQTRPHTPTVSLLLTITPHTPPFLSRRSVLMIPTHPQSHLSTSASHRSTCHTHNVVTNNKPTHVTHPPLSLPTPKGLRIVNDTASRTTTCSYKPERRNGCGGLAQVLESFRATNRG